MTGRTSPLYATSFTSNQEKVIASLKVDTVTYVTGSYRLTPKRTECKYLLKDAAFKFSTRYDMSAKIPRGGGEGGGDGGKLILGHPSIS